ncbi:MAG TPA: hypothetical protein VFN95_07185 [Flavitalea sp.]|nr:hypothetical protein [Flavitalea sp.]
MRLTNVEKALSGDITKADLIQYYHSVSDYILPQSGTEKFPSPGTFIPKSFQSGLRDNMEE